MGTTGSSANVAMNDDLPDIIARVREYAAVPIAVGFGVATRPHFDAVADAGANGVVIGSRIIGVIKESEDGTHVDAVERFCVEISLKGHPKAARSPSSPIRRSTERIK
jgi:tryptophan synthase